MPSAQTEPCFEFDIDDVLRLWPERLDVWMYVAVAENHAERVSQAFQARPHGFRSVPVIASIAKEQWKTALFRYQDGSWVLPLKAAVRRRHHLKEGDAVRVHVAAVD